MSDPKIGSALGTIRQLQDAPPVDVGKLAEAFGIRVWEDEMPDKISGKIFFDPVNGGPSNYSIVVNRKDPFVRKRFTVAHEIAHFILHRERIGSSLTDDALYRSGLTTREEAQANRLAAEILMPAHLLLGGIGGDAYVLAERFQVSEAAMSIRLESLRPK